jgi:NAD-dependent SIR2 family protein deacetylase
LEREDAKFIIINVRNTEIDDKADILFRERTVKVLSDILREVRKEIGHTKEQL